MWLRVSTGNTKDLIRRLAARDKSGVGAENGDCHQFSIRHGPRKKALSLRRIGWLYPIFQSPRYQALEPLVSLTPIGSWLSLSRWAAMSIP